uniref:Uncharacterized protein n=1 Tax=Knipowitschia caucasica TaxID=637954 RepID=A0AAV2MD82_KNICA
MSELIYGLRDWGFGGCGWGVCGWVGGGVGVVCVGWGGFCGVGWVGCGGLWGGGGGVYWLCGWCFVWI